MVGRGWEVRSKRKRSLVVAMMIFLYVAAEAFALRGWMVEGGGWRVKVRAALGMGSGTVRYAMLCYAMLCWRAMQWGAAACSGHGWWRRTGQ